MKFRTQIFNFMAKSASMTGSIILSVNTLSKGSFNNYVNNKRGLGCQSDLTHQGLSSDTVRRKSLVGQVKKRVDM